MKKDDGIIGYIPPGIDPNKLKCGIYTETWRQNNSKAHIGIKHTEETPHKLSEIAKNNPPMLGKHHTAETLQAISESLKGKTPWNKGMRTKKLKPAKPKKEKTPKLLKTTLPQGEAIRGERHHKNTITEVTARAIKIDIQAGMRICEAVRKYGATKSVIANIKHGIHGHGYR